MLFYQLLSELNLSKQKIAELLGIETDTVEGWTKDEDVPTWAWCLLEQMRNV